MKSKRIILGIFIAGLVMASCMSNHSEALSEVKYWYNKTILFPSNNKAYYSHSPMK